MSSDKSDQEDMTEQRTDNPVYVPPHIHKIDKVELITHGSKDKTDDSDTGGYKYTKEN